MHKNQIIKSDLKNLNQNETTEYILKIKLEGEINVKLI